MPQNFLVCYPRSSTLLALSARCRLPARTAQRASLPPHAPLQFQSRASHPATAVSSESAHCLTRLGAPLASSHPHPHPVRLCAPLTLLRACPHSLRRSRTLALPPLILLPPDSPGASIHAHHPDPSLRFLRATNALSSLSSLSSSSESSLSSESLSASSSSAAFSRSARSSSPTIAS